MGRLLSLESPPAEYPNHLACPRPERLELPPARWTLVLLVLLCLAPRIVTAVRVPSICVDGVIYIHAAKALESGNLRAALWEGGFNIYPAILAALHRVGFGWETGAALWGAVLSSLVVLPLWGWVRRQFDDRVALAACLLYAAHPRFIIESPEVMRDPTFWFFFMLAIYWLWRAVAEVRYRYFAAAGAAVALACFTRIEGLVLLVPLTLWTFWRWWALVEQRGKLLAGAALCVGAVPLLLLLVNAVLLCSGSDWTMMRLSPLARVHQWTASLLGAQVERGNQLSPPLPVGRMAWRFFPTLTRSFSPVFALLMFGGIWGWRRVWSRRDHQALFVTAAAILLGIWIQLWYERYTKSISPRYALPIVLMASPFAGLGLLGLLGRLQRIAAGLGRRAPRPQVVTAAALLALVAPAAADVANNTLTHAGTRRTVIEVGRWAKREFGPAPAIVAPFDLAPIVGFYAESPTCARYRYGEGAAAIAAMAAAAQADVVLLPAREPPDSGPGTPLAGHLKRLKLEPVGADVLPEANRDFRVFARTDRLARSQPSPPRR